MIVDFRTSGSWMNLNDKFCDLLTLDRSKTSVKIHGSTGAALVELASLLIQFSPNKKKIVYLKDFDPTIQPVVNLCSRLGFQCVGIPESELSNLDQLKSAISKDTLFFLNSYDDPFLGRTAFLQNVFSVCNEMSVMLLSVSHSFHTQNPSMLLPARQQSVVMATPVGLAVALSGERVRVGSLIADQLPFERLYTPGQIEMAVRSLLPADSSASADAEKRKEKILQFETRHDLKFDFVLNNHLSNGQGRLFDRAVVSWFDVDATAVIERLSKKMNLGLLGPGQDSMMETTSLSRWGGIKTMDWLTHQKMSKEAIRGMMIFSVDLLSEQFVEDLRQVRESIIADQG